jgi:uncharacterized protein DUF4397
MARRSWTGRVARLAAICSAVLVLTAGLAVVGPAAEAASPGYVRLAHLSPGTPQVDVYLTSFRGGSFSKVLEGVGYGAVSPYERVAAGTYTVSMRLAGADPDSPPVLSTNVTVVSRKAYTVAGVGPKSALKLRVLHDRLAQPSPNRAAVRVVQASVQAPDVDVVTSTGMRIASNARFPSTTRYLEVPAQRWMIQVRRHGSATVLARKAIDLPGGAIQTVLVLDGSDGVRLEVNADAAGSGVTPTGGVAAGLGGTADQGPTHRSTTPVIALLLTLATGLAMTTAWLARR